MVESPQSVANLLEAQMWDAYKQEPVAAVDGLPYLFLADAESGEYVLSSRDTPHRVASSWFLNGLGGQKKGQAFLSEVPPRLFAALADPVSLLFGFWFAQWIKGEVVADHKLARSALGRIVARNAERVHRGGVQFDGNFANETGGEAVDAASVGTGMIPFSDTNADQFMAESVTLHLDLRASRLRTLAAIPVIGPEVAQLSQSLFWHVVASLLDVGELDLRTEAIFDIVSDLDITTDGTGLEAAIAAYNKKRPEALAKFPMFAETLGQFEEPYGSGDGVRYRMSTKVAKSKAKAE